VPPTDLSPLLLKLRDRQLPTAFVARLAQEQNKVDADELLMYLKLAEHHLIQHYEGVLYGNEMRPEDRLRVELSQRDADCDQFLRGLGSDADTGSIRWWQLRSLLEMVALEGGLTGDIRPCRACNTRKEAIDVVLSHLHLLENCLDRFYSARSAPQAAKHLLDVYGVVLELHPMCVALSYWK